MIIEQRRQRNRRKNYLFFLLFGVMVALVLIFRRQPQTLPGPVPQNTGAVISLATRSAKLSFVPEIPSSPGLVTAVSQTLTGTRGTYGLVVKNFKTGEAFFQNDHQVFEPASVYKLWIMAVVVNQIQAGKLHEDDQLSAEVADLNREFFISDTDAEQTSGTVSHSVNDALTQMITVSDNYSALLLTHRVGLPAVDAFLKDNGFVQSKIGVNGQAPTTTPADIALFLEKLYRGQLANPEFTEKMLTLLKQQRLNDDLPKYLPDKVAVAHKTGAMEPFVHDAGIVYTDFGDYLIVVFSETDSRPAAEERIALVSQAVYQYFSGQNATP